MHWSNFPASLRIWTIAGVLALLICFGVIWAQTVPPAPNQAPPTQTPASPAVVTPPRPAVMIDPAHGGSESGAVLSPVILEKDVNFAFARRLRQDLTSRGILSQLTREADVNLSTDDRAAKANAAHPLLYICLHASSEGGGATLFSAILPEAVNNNEPFIDWNTAQSASLAASRTVEQQLAGSLQRSGISARALMAPVQPLNSITAPALAIEISPTGADVSQLIAPEFQQKISVALANGIAGIIPALAQSSGAQH